MKHTFEIDGVIINPELPEDFDITPNDERSEEEINNWWNKPYILIDELQQESWEEHYHRLKTPIYGFTDEQIGTKENWLKHLKEQKENWYKEYPDGFRYNLRCLDGGAWDRSTNHGFYATFDEAIKAAKELQTNTFDAVTDIRDLIKTENQTEDLENYEDKIYELESDLEDKLSEIEEHSINMQIIVKKMKEENIRASECDGHEANDLANFNLYQLEQIEKLVSELKFEKVIKPDTLTATENLREMIKSENQAKNLEI